MEHKLNMFIEHQGLETFVEVFIDIQPQGEERAAMATVSYILDKHGDDIRFHELLQSDQMRITERAWEAAQEHRRSAEIEAVRISEEKSDNMKREG